MEKELVDLFERVKKAADTAAADVEADSSPEEDRCLDALKRLKGLPINYDVLVSTVVGKRLGRLTKHPRERIRALASDVVEMWEVIIVQETEKNRKNGSIENEGSGDEEEVQRIYSVEVEDSVKAEPELEEYDDGKKMQKASSVKIKRIDRSNSSNSEEVTKYETNSAEIKVDNGDTVKAGEGEKFGSDSKKLAVPVGPPILNSSPSTKDKNRDKIRDFIAETLRKVAGEVDEDTREEVDACDPFRVATEVESAMFARWGLFNGAQKMKHRFVMFHLRDPNNPDFRRKVLLGQFSPESITDLSPEDVASDEQNGKFKKKALFEGKRGPPFEVSTDQFRCVRCRKSNCTYYRPQPCSADEPVITYVTCVNCGYGFKFI